MNIKIIKNVIKSTKNLLLLYEYKKIAEKQYFQLTGYSTRKSHLKNQIIDYKKYISNRKKYLNRYLLVKLFLKLKNLD